MDQASALLAASCERNPAAPRTSSSCSRFEDQSQTGALPPARLDPQSAPRAAPSSRDPRPSSPALCSTQRDICCRIFTPAQPEYPAASVRDNCSGAYTRKLREERFQFGVIFTQLFCPLIRRRNDSGVLAFDRSTHVQI